MNKIVEFFNSIKAVSASTEKKNLLARQVGNKEITEILKFIYDTRITTGISDKKYNSVETAEKREISLSDVLKYLKEHNTGRTEDILFVKSAENYLCNTAEEKEAFKAIVTKNVILGIDTKTVNKVFGNIIPTTDVMLANKYFDKPELVNGSREFVLQEKLDGCRCVAIKENGNVSLLSRQGKEWTGLNEIIAAIKAMPEDNIVLDGELLITNRKGVDSKLQYKETTKIISAKNDNKVGITYNVFDILSLVEWTTKVSEKPYMQRYGHLCSVAAGLPHIHIVKNIYKGNDVNAISTMLQSIAKPNNWEGLMIRFTDSRYEFKRSNELLKVKLMQEMDLTITGIEEGTNRNTGKLGAFICSINHPEYGTINAKVGSGYSDEERNRFWSERENLTGRTISVQYFEITTNDKGGKSLRFPVFLELKEEGQTPNN